MMDETKKVTELTDEELMELTGGQSFVGGVAENNTASLIAIALYGIVPKYEIYPIVIKYGIPVLKYGIAPLYGIRLSSEL